MSRQSRNATARLKSGDCPDVDSVFEMSLINGQQRIGRRLFPDTRFRPECLGQAKVALSLIKPLLVGMQLPLSLNGKGALHKRRKLMLFAEVFKLAGESLMISRIG